MAEEILEVANETPLTVISGEGANGSSWTKEAIDPAGIQRNRLRVDTMKFLMSKLAPKRYGEKTQTELTGANGGPITYVATSILEETK